MVIEKQNTIKVENYTKLLTSVGALSKLFSESDKPYLYYRIAENIFCKAFGADNLSRSDTSADAKLGNFGIGLKTFLNTKSNSSFQKIAEFNKNRDLYKDLVNDSNKLINAISEYRNLRITATAEIHDISNLIYHSVVRDTERFYISEEPMNLIDIGNISNVHQKKSTIYFEDGKEAYSFNISKSTLYKRFNNNSILDFGVEILDDPFELLEKFNQTKKDYEISKPTYKGIVYLPLYSLQGKRNVPEASGLNAWHAGGRRRDPREVYLPIPKWIHRTFPDFFPTRDKPFKLRLPNSTILDVKVCQDNSKALTSKHNADLGKWILGDILKIPEGQLVTIEMLDKIGIDSVEIRKVDEDNFEIDFKETGTYDEFFNTNSELITDEGAE